MTASDESTRQNGASEQERRVSPIKHKFNKIREIITVEPMLCFYQMGVLLSKPALDNLEFEKACKVNLGYNDSVCNTILGGDHTNYSIENCNIQIVISKMHSWQQPVQTVVPLILILFLGSYSDKCKWRKPLFTIPLLGDLLGHIGCILCVLNWRTWPLEVQGAFQKILPSLCGSQAMFVMAITAYLCDITSVESRTFRIGLITILFSVVALLANSASGILYAKLGYQGILSLTVVLLVLSLCYGVFWVKETRTISNDGNVLKRVFDPKNVLDTLNVLFKKSSHASHLYAMLLLVFIHRFATEGDRSLLYLYVQNVFGWTVVEYTRFLTAQSFVTLIGNILGLYVVVKIFAIDDLIILFVTVFTSIVSNVTFGCASTSLVFSLGIVTGVMTKLYRIAKRSYITKIVSGEDIGKTLSLITIAEAISPALAVPLYNTIYIHTLQIFPAATYFFSVIFFSIDCGIVLWLYLSLQGKSEVVNIEGEGQYKKTDYESHYM